MSHDVLVTIGNRDRIHPYHPATCVVFNAEVDTKNRTVLRSIGHAGEGREIERTVCAWSRGNECDAQRALRCIPKRGQPSHRDGGPQLIAEHFAHEYAAITARIALFE
jgi:hypothetical protein